MSQVTPHTSHVTRHTSHVTRHTSHITRHTSHVTRHTPHVTYHKSHVTRHTSHVTRHTSRHRAITRKYGPSGPQRKRAAGRNGRSVPVDGRAGGRWRRRYGGGSERGDGGERLAGRAGAEREDVKLAVKTRAGSSGNLGLAAPSGAKRRAAGASAAAASACDAGPKD